MTPTPASQRYKVTLAYRGTRYHGWQRQTLPPTWKGPAPEEGHGIPTIQELVSRAIASVLGHPIDLVGSSRTDAGVHAKGQLAHFDTDQLQVPPEGLRRAVNHRLPDDILLREIEPVPDTFDAIRSTTRKRYQYAIWNASDRPAFFGELVWHRWQRLDIDAMRQAASCLVGEHDFASFCRPGHQRVSTVRTIYSCEVSQRGPRLVVGVEGSGFLWHMVRIITGTLIEVAIGRFKPDDIPRMLAAKDRQSAGGTAPPCGLYLQWIQTSAGPTSDPGSSPTMADE